MFSFQAIIMTIATLLLIFCLIFIGLSLRNNKFVESEKYHPAPPNPSASF
jgi:hypothetical protein